MVAGTDAEWFRRTCGIAGDKAVRPGCAGCPREQKAESDEMLITNFAPSRLRMELDRVPLWRGDHVSVRQVVEDFATYLYLPRLADPSVLLKAIRDGLGCLTWEQDSFGFAEGYDEANKRYRALRAGEIIELPEAASQSLIVKSDVARKQLDVEIPKPEQETFPRPSSSLAG